MKSQKNLWLMLLASGAPLFTKAQTLNEKADTLNLRLNGENTTILVPPPGKKTTVIFEDTGSLIQINILKLNKRSKLFSGIEQESSKVETTIFKKKKWFNEFDLGLTINNSFIRASTKNQYQNNRNIDSAAVLISGQSDYFSVPKAGFRITINIKETERPILKSSIYSYISGYRLYLDYSLAKAIRDNYYPSAGYYSQYQGTVNSYYFFNQLFFPFGLVKKFEEHNQLLTRMEVGLTLGLTLKYSFDRFNYGQSISAEGEDNVAANIASQVYIKLYKKHFFLSLSREMNARTYGIDKHETYTISKNKTLRTNYSSANTGLISLGIGYRFH